MSLKELEAIDEAELEQPGTEADEKLGDITNDFLNKPDKTDQRNGGPLGYSANIHPQSKSSTN